MAEEILDDATANTKEDTAQLSSGSANPNTVVRISLRSGVFATATPLVIPVLHVLASDMIHNVSFDFRCSKFFLNYRGCSK
jgi:hypothetical protein